MSSIDKYVISEAHNCDYRVRVTNSRGRIRGYIGNELIFDIADRHGYLSDSERRTIHQSINEYKRNEERIREEERRRRLEEERRRLEAERQAKLASLRRKIDSKAPVIEANISAIKSSYNSKVKDVSNVDKLIGEIKSIFPEGDVSNLVTQKNAILNTINSRFERLLSELNSKKNEVEAVNRKIRNDLTTAQIEQLERELDRISFKTSEVDLNVDQSTLLEKIKVVKKNVESLKDLLASSNVITDEYVKKQIELEISGINVCDNDSISRSMLSIVNRIEKHRLTLNNAQIKAQIKELDRIESLALGIKKFNEYHVSDTYVVSEVSEEIVNKVKTIVDDLLDLAELKYNVLDFDLGIVMNELYQIISNPKNTTEVNSIIKRYESIVKSSKDKAAQYKEQYEIYEELIKELNELGEQYQGYFDCKNYKKQFNEIESLIIEKIKEQEIEILESTAYDITSKMYDTGYEIFSLEGNEHYKEIYYINKKYPGVLTRVMVDNKGSFRRTLVGVSIDGVATKPEKILEMSVEMENDVQEFIQSYSQTNEISFGDMTSYDSEDAVEKILENGYLDLKGEGADLFKEYHGTAIVKEQKTSTYVNIFEDYNESIHKQTDTSADKKRIAANSNSQARAKKRK